MPSRLASLVRNVKDARSYREILTALNTSLTNMNVKLWLCQWHWNEKRKDVLFPKDIKNMPGDGNFFHFDKLQHGIRKVQEVASYAVNEDDSDDQDVEDIDGGGTAEKVRSCVVDRDFSAFCQIYK